MRFKATLRRVTELFNQWETFRVNFVNEGGGRVGDVSIARPVLDQTVIELGWLGTDGYFHTGKYWTPWGTWDKATEQDVSKMIDDAITSVLTKANCGWRGEREITWPE